MSQKSKKKGAPGSVPTAPVEKGAPAGTARPGSRDLSAADEFEPYAESASIPVWFFVALLLLLYWGMIHLDRYSGGFSSFVYGPYRSYNQLADLAPKSGPEMLIARGETVYGMVCVACHQQSGAGSPGQYPPLAGSEWVVGPANRLIRIPLHGLTGNVTVKGEAWDKNMPAFGTTPPLDDDESLAAVLTFVRQAFGNKAGPITPEQVKAVRADTASRSSPWTADELLKIE